jgi:hypothetical protein
LELELIYLIIPQVRVKRGSRSRHLPSRRFYENSQDFFAESFVVGNQSTDWAESVSLPFETAAAAPVSTTMPGEGISLSEASEWRAVAVDLQSPLMQLGVIDGIYVVVEGIPPGVRFSAGRYNGDDTWSLAPGELEELHAFLPGERTDPFALTVRVLTPDPCGYDYASTTATFDVVVTPGAVPSAITAIPRQLLQGRPLGSLVAPPDDPRAAEDRRLAAARAEWQAEEALRLERASAQWEAAARAQWSVEEAALKARHAADLAAAESRWRHREVARIAAAEALWNVRAAATEATQHAMEPPCPPVKSGAGLGFRGGWISTGLVAAFGIASMALLASAAL